MINIKPYPLDWKLLQVLKEFRYANIEGLFGAVSKDYSIHTVRKTVKVLENKQFIYSVRDDNKRKIYALTENGKEYLKKIDINFNGLQELEYSEICLKWSNWIGGKTTINNLPKGINALNVDDKGDLTALVIENVNKSFKELISELESITEGSIFYKEIYLVMFTTHREADIPSKVGEIDIKIFKV